MKTKLSYILIGILLFFSACKEEEFPEVIEISVSSNVITFPPEGGNYRITVISNAEWEVEIDYDNFYWCAVEVGQSNSDAIYIDVSRINSETPRETRIIVRNSNVRNNCIVSDTVTVMQKGWTVPDDGVLIDGVIWATRNVDAFGTFAESPFHSGSFYQFNDIVAYTAIACGESNGNFTVFPDWKSAEFSEIWLPENNPCPSGWRIPTSNEMFALISSDYRYDNALNGFFFGTNNEIFLPAGGFIKNGDVESVLTVGRYWVENGVIDNENSVIYQYLQFYTDSQGSFARYISANTHNVQYAFSVRCVKN